MLMFVLWAVCAVQSTGNKSNVSTLAANERKTEAVQALAANAKPNVSTLATNDAAEKQPGSSARLSAARLSATQELSNEYLLAKFRFDTAENEPLKVCQKIAKSWNRS